MIQSLLDRYLGEGLSVERKSFNIIHIIAVIGLSLSNLLVYVYIPNLTVFYFSFGIVILTMLTFVEANRVNNIKYPAIIMSIIINFIYFPMIYFNYGQLICAIPVYFLFGLLYTVLLIEGNWGIVLTASETLFYAVIIIYGNYFLFKSDKTIFSNALDYSSVLIAIIVSGIIGGLTVKFKIKIQQKEKEKADKLHAQVMKDYLSKDVFLINMSHEIRTPMNAIVGTVNLLLDQNINDRVRDSALNILNSCNALLSITNELMEISQSDNSVQFQKTRYDFSELLMEIINMMSVRLMDSTVNFYVEITDSVAHYMYSDISKIRQLLINVLNNAIKYTKSGKIILRIDAKKIDDENDLLMFEVEDTGKGIKEEVIPKLFNVYEDISDIDSSPKIEGIGLGLSICKAIIDNLGGEIHVESTYHVGSTFYFSFPQKVEPNNYLIKHNSNELVSAIVYEKDAEHSEYLCNILKLLNVKYVCSANDFELEKMIMTHQYTHIFIAYEKYMDCIKFLDNGIVNEKLVIISYILQSISINQYGSIITRPAHALNISSALFNENNNYVHEIITKGGFSCPNATVLVVDDNLTNISVASGLLKKYNTTVITALSGRECINILEKQKADIIFLDYMMPEMDGIDTLHAIRAMDDPFYKTVPVVALTANVVNGAKEMFLKEGFDYYISKPIEMDRIERALKTFLPRDLIEINNRK